MKLHLSRRYRFSASHRLHSAQLGEEENRRVYGKCNNPYRHGSCNYVVEVCVSGPVDPSTGMIANLTDLDAFVENEIIEPFDHTYLNEEIAEFRENVPTTENILHRDFQSPEPFSARHVERVRVEETGLNSFEYAGEPTGAQR